MDLQSTRSHREASYPILGRLPTQHGARVINLVSRPIPDLDKWSG